MANTDHFGSPEKHDFPLVSDRETSWMTENNLEPNHLNLIFKLKNAGNKI